MKLVLSDQAWSPTHSAVDAMIHAKVPVRFLAVKRNRTGTTLRRDLHPLQLAV